MGFNIFKYRPKEYGQSNGIQSCNAFQMNIYPDPQNSFTENQRGTIHELHICRISSSPGAKGLKWRFFAHESVQAEFGLKL